MSQLPVLPVIEVNGVGKEFVQHQQLPSLRAEATQLIKRWVGLAKPLPHETFWALRDVNFRVQAGESLGIVGANGAGKSTLIRMLANIIAPTTGEIIVRGRFSALIGLSAGFDAMRTGRENIYLNAAIFGLTRGEIEGLLDEIIAFAEIGEFIDQPVKYYSSGMLARLGFSVAVHFLPEIIMLDEILAVGDMAFQRKCYARMQQLRGSSTMILVMHSGATIRDMCDRAIWLHKGTVAMDGPSGDVVDAYEAFNHVRHDDAAAHALDTPDFLAP
ncbi:MAG: ABC transporter ATP-binding protein [Pleurocapsa minor GSE-CHR-MK-17-07R]|jgi:ABC-type polysaccharide/polyol phosphate transport system ATPase subunit|nr:ABC transporter ATP-binding protein [Pleurocapsa minor GSE-CHR-MK 17-07R]